MVIKLKTTIPSKDKGRLLMPLPYDETRVLDKLPTQKVIAVINKKKYTCNLFYKEDDIFYLHITRLIKKEVGLGSRVSLTLETTEENEETNKIHNDVLDWETSKCKHIMKEVGIKENDTIADFGCGYGHYTIGCALALENTGKVIAIDCDSKALKWINEKEKMFSINNIETIKTSGESTISLPDSSVDVILLYDILHIQDKNTGKSLAPSLYKEAYRVLKKNGILSILNFISDVKTMKMENNQQMTFDDIHNDIINVGFSFSHSVENGVHFDWYHSSYRLKKGLLFSQLEKGVIQNYIK
ncbi:class I SAM-dependent methyltransferase [Breznakia pachnodae]|uniref:Precorrin-6B methylase 2 n=1 Tax=Breznakia pachnodae TaxID=265178 RepID=A0ABU0E062_9FIRM|nr:class I SAM-dependent methyltransferase [Breznakia pachnodae]MDQ0360195.1 precorrin-6B methylase 2 [Breznakia pachnodae]